MLFWSCWVGTNFLIQIKPCIFSVSFLFFGLELLLRCGIFFSWSELEAAVSGGKFCSVPLHTRERKKTHSKYHFKRNDTSVLGVLTNRCISSTLILQVWSMLGKTVLQMYLAFPFSVLFSKKHYLPASDMVFPILNSSDTVRHFRKGFSLHN